MIEPSVVVTSKRRSDLARRFLVRHPRAVPVAIFLAISAVTTVSVFAIEAGEAKRERVVLEEATRSIAAALDRRGASSSSYLRAGAALFAASKDVTPQLFRRFVGELRLGSDFRGSDGIGWAAALKPGDIGAFEMSMAAEGEGQVSVRPEAGPDVRQVVPVTFLEPDSIRNRRAIGYDMYSNPARRQAMDEAEQMVRPTATGKIVLVQEGGNNDAGFLIYMPVFEVQSGGRELRGFIYSPFNTHDFLDSALEDVSRENMGVGLYDGVVRPENLMADHAPFRETGNTVQRKVTIAQRSWTIVVESPNSQFLSQLSMATLLFGFLVASLLMLLARILARQAIEDQATLEKFEQQESIRNSLVRELNHRVKNTLANVLSIIALTRRRTKSLDDFADGLDGRIRALSATHDLLTQSEWGATPMRAVLEAELKPYVSQSDAALEIKGPVVELAPNDALTMGLAIHELATNAAKYGAFSTPNGRVSISWKLVEANLAMLEWKELGGPPVKAPEGRGFGTELIERVVAHELKHPVKLEFPADGVRCTLSVPVRQREAFRLREGKPDPEDEA